jgi:hypothetical protein
MDFNNQKLSKVLLLSSTPTNIIMPTQGIGKNDIFHRHYYGSAMENMGDTYQDLYLVSNDDIQEEDWVLELTGLGWYKPVKVTKEYLKVDDYIIRCKKIKFTTNKNLIGNNNIFNIPDEYIKQNINNLKDEKLVEVKLDLQDKDINFDRFTLQINNKIFNINN